MNNLTVTYEELSSAAENMKTQANVITDQVKNIGEEMDTLKTIWQGEASTAYSAKFTELQPALQKTVAKIAEYGEKLATIAENYKDNETESSSQTGNLGTDIFS